MENMMKLMMAQNEELKETVAKLEKQNKELKRIARNNESHIGAITECLCLVLSSGGVGNNVSAREMLDFIVNKEYTTQEVDDLTTQLAVILSIGETIGFPNDESVKLVNEKERQEKSAKEKEHTCNCGNEHTCDGNCHCHEDKTEKDREEEVIDFLKMLFGDK